MITRKSAFDKSQKKEQAVFIKAVEKLIKNGEYTKFVNRHANMGGFRMHGMGYLGSVGMLRFLAWHRLFLREFEDALRKQEPTAYIPYWKWTDGGVPDWMTAFQPTVKGVRRLASSHMDLKPKFHPPATVVVKRKNIDYAFTTQKKIDLILSRPTFVKFTSDLESGPHNRGHNLLGGGRALLTMATEISPADPMFWLHHANVDRIWALWQVKNPKGKVELKGPMGATPAEKAAFIKLWSVLNPFGVRIDKASRPTKLMGYTYG